MDSNALSWCQKYVQNMTPLNNWGADWQNGVGFTAILNSYPTLTVFNHCILSISIIFPRIISLIFKQTLFFVISFVYSRFTADSLLGCSFSPFNLLIMH